MGETDAARPGMRRLRAARRNRRRRIIRRRRVAAGLLLLALVGAIAATVNWVKGSDAVELGRVGAAAGRSGAPESTSDAGDATQAGSAVPGPGSPGGPGAPTTAPTTDQASLPLSPAVAAKVPATSTQVVLVEGTGIDSNKATVRLLQRDSGWVEKGSWSAHVGKSGWSANHREGDLRTPIGVFTLSDAGGRLADPGAALPYHRSNAFQAPAPSPGFGDSDIDAFDYVVAIDYNRVPGRSPLDWTRPKGMGAGGGIWLHVDRGGPTHGCVALPKAAMKLLLTELDPKRRPVVVMGPSDSL
ncbi:L,D-transpeptidase family protein [Knoellia koreensis]|nr:L,D-transpeptidase family protein [Knoellia sp. DB2414S]